MEEKQKPELTTDKLTDYHGRFVQFGSVHEFMHGRGSVTLCAQFAMELLKNDAHNGLSMDSSGQAMRAAELAQAWFDECKRRGWIIELPPLDEGDKRTLTSPALAQLSAQMGAVNGRRN